MNNEKHTVFTTIQSSGGTASKVMMDDDDDDVHPSAVVCVKNAKNKSKKF